MLKPLALSILAAVILVVAVMKLLGRDDPADSYLSPETTSESAADSHAGVDAELVGETESGERTGAKKVVPEPPLDPEPTAASHSFLPEELQEVAFLLPEYFDSFQQASARDKFSQAREVLSFSIAILMCANGSGPLPMEDPEAGNLSYTGQDGFWSFHLNGRTFKFSDYEYPEYAEYIPLLNKAMFPTDEEGNSLPPIAMELPPDLEARIQHRVFEALARFEH